MPALRKKLVECVPDKLLGYLSKTSLSNTCKHCRSGQNHHVCIPTPVTFHKPPLHTNQRMLSTASSAVAHLHTNTAKTPSTNRITTTPAARTSPPSKTSNP